VRTGFCHLALAAAVILLAAGSLRADLAAARAEPNLEKRSQLALDNADRALKSSREAYRKGDLDQAAARIQELRESVDLAEKSLIETGKDPRRKSKWFKRAEIRTRDLMRKLDAFDREMNFADRNILAETKARIQQVHDDLLTGIMEGKKK
jgi:hypothetical protein